MGTLLSMLQHHRIPLTSCNFYDAYASATRQLSTTYAMHDYFYGNLMNSSNQDSKKFSDLLDSELLHVLDVAGFMLASMNFAIVYG